ncbi:MAG: non-ribosomal peptide synthetase [Phycisphaeraceae bacterium]|nr:non-ribosomal peptide synthetase [Phycisphaeraceae bacterium]
MPANLSYPLSPVQEGMLYHSLGAPRSGVYVQQLVCRIRGPLDVEPFDRAWRAVVAQHDALRTSFDLEGGDHPAQRVHAGVELEWSLLDWRDLSAPTRNDQLARLLAEDRSRGFDTARPPVMRMTMIRIGDGEHRWIWTSHHALLDGRSRAIVLQQVLASYDALIRNVSIDLPAAVPFRNHVEFLTQRDSTMSTGFFQQQLAGVTEATSILVEPETTDAPAASSSYSDPADGPSPPSLALSAESTAALSTMADRHGLTLNTLVQAAWALLCGRYADRDDVIFGATRACRHGSVDGAADMVGLLINTVPMRVRIEQDRPLVEWLRDLRAQWIAMRDHELTPLTAIQRCSDVPADRPLFESVVMFEHVALDARIDAPADTNLELDFELRQQSNYPLTLVATGGSRLALALHHDRERVSQRAAARALGHLRTLLEDMAARPESRVGDVRLMTEAERQEVLALGYPEPCDYPRQSTIHQQFEARAQATPDRVALEFEGAEMTYEQLNRRADRLARRLRCLDVGPDVPVGLCAPRSMDMVAAMIAILKAGGAYVPLDADYPQRRLQFMLEDSGAGVLVCDDAHAQQFEGFDGTLVRLGDAFETPDVPDDEDIATTPCTADHLAYLIYTSGSTGRPKGAGITHRGVVRLVKDTNYVDVGPEDVLLQSAPISFDASTFETWAGLLNGARLVISPPDTPTLERLGALVRDRGVTILWLTAALFHQVVDAHLPSLSGVRRILAGGDVLSPGHVRRVIATLGDRSIINGYGPTENTTFTCCHVMNGDSTVGRTVPIGRPISHTYVRILDAQMRPVPKGVHGELYIGGDGLARAYHNDPSLTAERFVADPFAGADTGSDAARLYRTGDVARYLEDGTIEFLGRRDHQVKIRGYRIELGEIEATLLDHPQVRETAVVCRDAEAGQKQLAAYVVADAPAPTAGALRSFLGERLATYMIPPVIVHLDELPLTPSGKVDRRALPAPQVTEMVTTEYQAPRTPSEQRIVALWQQVLEVDRIGVHDSFFELGGHSLRATQVLSRVRVAFGVELSVRDVFQHPTPARLATLIEARRDGPEPIAAAPAITRQPRLPRRVQKSTTPQPR